MPPRRSAANPRERLPQFGENAYTRHGLAAWDETWHGLSVEERGVYLGLIDRKVESWESLKPFTEAPLRAPAPPAFAELVAAGLVGPAKPAGGPEGGLKVLLAPEATGFATRALALLRFRPLRSEPAAFLNRYIDKVWTVYRFDEFVKQVFKAVGFGGSYYGIDTFGLLGSDRWAAWVAGAAGEPLAWAVLGELARSAGPVPLHELLAERGLGEPAAVRRALDRLVSAAVVFEDFDPRTHELVAGLLPGVGLRVAGRLRPAARPELAACERPRSVAGDPGFFAQDLRVVLLESLGEPPRLKQDGGLYARETERFTAALDPLPEGLFSLLRLDAGARLEQAVDRALMLKFVDEAAGAGDRRLVVTPAGRRWLGLPPAAQYEALFREHRKIARYGEHGVLDGMLVPSGDPIFGEPAYGKSDAGFLGCQVVVALGARPKTGRAYGFEPKDADVHALREAVARVFRELEPGTFYTAESLIGRHTHGEHCVLHCGRPAEEVSVALGARLVPADEGERAWAAHFLLTAVVYTRLIPLGCLRTGVDDRGRLCVATTPRLAAYFGEAPAGGEGGDAGTAAAADAPTRVVVQPDFSVLVIGVDLSPVADLARFCERVTLRGGAGAHTLRLTRESVTRAAGDGQTADTMLATLRGLADHELPANVEREVKEWAGLVRKVKAETLRVIRCPDAGTADRLLSALKSKAERLSDTLVALRTDTLTRPEREKLRAQGLILEGTWARFEKPKARARRG